jgi:flagellar biosynthetic protein FliR
MLLLTRISAMFNVFPVFSWASIPVRVRVVMTLAVTVFFATILPVPDAAKGHVHWMDAMVLMGGEAVIGGAIGLSVGIFFTAVQQGGVLASRSMGFAMARIVDPITGQEGKVLDMIFQVIFLLLFLATDGHHLLLQIADISFETFPVGEMPDLGLLVSGLIRASSAMLQYALRLAAPVLAGFLLLSVVLGVLARIAPEMNILMIGFPLRIALGLSLAAALASTLDEFVMELTQWVRLSMFH